MEAKDILQELEAAMRQLCEIKNRLRKVAAMLTPEQERQPDLFSDMGLTKEPMEEKIKRATERWKGVDVDKFMADVRGTEPEEPETDIPAEPQPQLFEGIRKALDEAVEEATIVGPGKPRKTWKRLGVQMKDEAIVAAEKVGRKSGWCQRSDIERSLQRRNPERSREDIREAVNGAVGELGLTCVKYNSYRFYRTADRGRIIARSLAKLCVA